MMDSVIEPIDFRGGWFQGGKVEASFMLGAIILGINAYHADASACIIVERKLVAAIEEERINRFKHFSGYPIQSIKECLKIANKKSYEITDIAFNTRPLSNFVPKLNFFLKVLNFIFELIFLSLLTAANDLFFFISLVLKIICRLRLDISTLS